MRKAGRSGRSRRIQLRRPRLARPFRVGPVRRRATWVLLSHPQPAGVAGQVRESAITNTLRTRLATSRLYGRQREVAAPGECVHRELPIGTQSAMNEQGASRVFQGESRAPTPVE